MAANLVSNNKAYGVQNALQKLNPPPAVFNRVPTGDDQANIGQAWIYPATNQVFMLTGIVDGQSEWTPIGGGGMINIPVTVDQGGLGVTSLVPFAPLFGGDTPTDPVQQTVDSGKVGQYLGSNGAGMAPTWKNFITFGTLYVAAGDGTHTFLPGNMGCSVEIWGAGGGSAGIYVPLGDSCAIASNGGGGGGYQKRDFLNTDLGPTLTFHIGAGGAGGISTAAGSATEYLGSDGEDTVAHGPLGDFSAFGGKAGEANGPVTTNNGGGNDAGGQHLGGTGESGGQGNLFVVASNPLSAMGGDGGAGAFYAGPSTRSQWNSTLSVWNPIGQGPSAGGAGGGVATSSAPAIIQFDGANGGNGQVYITEYSQFTF